ncbi:hypothetical protein NDU88_005694 [Pleurodeles waltl]|uniref:Uncharacterized protein n=1 Tax=Pleurodeles waltl TaxID=8319 RepID=A0AAV7MB94_PLEWA|nr:hypothetical protein NDU88_005694 [Pleurodeles waltl]
MQKPLIIKTHRHCDGPLLPQADTPYPEDENCTATSDLEVQCVRTNPLAHPGAEGQEKPICAIIQGQKEEEWDETGRTEREEDTEREHGRRRRTQQVKQRKLQYRLPSRNPYRRLDVPNQRHGRRRPQALAALGEKRGPFRCVAGKNLRRGKDRCLGLCFGVL